MAPSTGLPITLVVLVYRVDRPGEGFHPIRPRSRPRRRPKRCLHHFVSHPAKEDGIGLVEVLDRVTMKVFVREHFTMIAAHGVVNISADQRTKNIVLRNGRFLSPEHFTATKWAGSAHARAKRVPAVWGWGSKSALREFHFGLTGPEGLFCRSKPISDNTFIFIGHVTCPID